MREKQKKRIKKLGFSEAAFKPSEKTIEERLLLLEQQMTSLSFNLKQISDSVQALIKKDDPEMPVGDYLNPIHYEAGMKVVKNKFYTDGENIWEAIKSGKPSGFNDKSFFSIVEV